MAEIVLKKGTVISHTELETNEVVIFADEVTGSMKKMNHLGEVVTFAEGLTLEQIEDMLGNSFKDSSTVAFVYTDALSSPFSAFVKQDGLDHTQIQNIGTNTHAQIDTFISNINETITDKINDTVLTTSPLNKVFNDTANTLALSLANSGVTSGTYGSATQSNSITVDALGRVTSASNVAISIPSTQISDITEKIQDTVATMLVPQFPMLTSYDDAGDGSLQIGLDISSISHADIADIGTNTHAQIDTHLASVANPHATTALQVGADPSGTALGLISAHTSLSDPHTQYAKEADLSDVATTGNYNDLNNTPSIIPFINSPTPNATGQFLYWDSVQQKFRPTTGGWAFDVLTQPTSGQLLQYTLTGSRFNLANVGDVLSYGNISDLANVTNDPPTNGQVLTYDSMQGAWKPATNASANIFGSEFQEQTRDTLASTTSTTPLLYTSFSKTVPPGKYRIGAFIICNLSTTTSNFISQLRINGNVIGEMSIEANESGTDIRTPSSGFFYYTVATPQTLEVEIYFRPEVNGITARIYYATLEFWRVQ